MKISEISKEQYEVGVINSIKTKHKDLRQESKAPTFALTYQGTWRALVTNVGLPEDVAKAIEKKYHELYKESDEYVKHHIEEAYTNGYVIGAFGLKLRTPLLRSFVMEGNHCSKLAQAEARTAGNHLGQSWCLLNCRASVEVMNKVWNSPYKTDILPVLAIHDAQYFFVKDDLEVVSWLNEVLIEAMSWQDDPNIYHDKVKLGAELELFYPDWAHGIEIPNHATPEQIVEEIYNSVKGK